MNFSRAAEELLLTQSAVTQQIKALEEERGVPLFDRSGGHITLTPGGQPLLPLRRGRRSPQRRHLQQWPVLWGEMRASWPSELRRRTDNICYPTLWRVLCWGMSALMVFFEKIRDATKSSLRPKCHSQQNSRSTSGVGRLLAGARCEEKNDFYEQVLGVKG
jgi:hypothetical protein